MTALSVLSAIVSGTSLSIAAEITFSAPMTFVCTASNGLYSHAGTCLSAAAWTMTSTPRVAIRSRSRSRTSPISRRMRGSDERARELGLLELVAAERPDRLDVVALEDGPHERGAERAGGAGHEQGFSGEVHYDGRRAGRKLAGV